MTQYRILRTGLGGSLKNLSTTGGLTGRVPPAWAFPSCTIHYGLKNMPEGILERLFAGRTGLARPLIRAHPATGETYGQWSRRISFHPSWNK